MIERLLWLESGRRNQHAKNGLDYYCLERRLGNFNLLMNFFNPMKLVQLQLENPWRLLLSVLLITVVGAVVASGLKFESSYEALLPEGAPEVENAHRVREKTGGVMQTVVAISGDSLDARIRFGRRLVDELRSIEGVRSVAFEYDASFFKDRGFWLMDVSTLDELLLAIDHATKLAKWQANPFNFGLDEEAESKEVEAAWKKVEDIVEAQRTGFRFDDVLTSKDNQYVFMLVTSSITTLDMRAGRALLGAIHRKIESLDPKGAGVVVRTAGKLDLLQEQHETLTADLRNAALLALVLGVLLIVTFTRRLVAPFLIGIALLAGVIWTFALVRILIGHVNIITGFLVAVLIGLGIDFGIHLLARYQQELKAGRIDASRAMASAVVGTLKPALIGALTTAGTFFSFSIADFRGFSEFGIVAGTGVLLTLASTFIILPPLLVVTQSGSVLRSMTLPEFWCPQMIRRPVALGFSAVILVAAVIGIVNMGGIQFRNNFRMLRGESEATSFLDYVEANLSIGISPAVFLAQSIEDAFAIRATVRDQQTGPAGSRIGGSFSIADLLPKEPDRQLSRIEKLRALLNDRKLDVTALENNARGEQLRRARRMLQAGTWTEKDVPEALRKRLLTRDGGEHLVLVWPAERNDADYQAAAWEEELNLISKKLSQKGVSHSKADEILTLAWIYRMIKKDGLWLLGMAAIVVLIILALHLRSFKETLLIAFPLVTGMGLFAFVLYVTEVELNMFNLIVLPSIIGIGVDNTIHIFHRYKSEGCGSVTTVLRTTGMAALMASLTTAVGFGSALMSHHVGLQSMGTLAIIGISCTFVASTLFFACLLSLLEPVDEFIGSLWQQPPIRSRNGSAHRN